MNYFGLNLYDYEIQFKRNTFFVGIFG